MRNLCIALVLAAALLVAGRAHATPFEPATIPERVEATGHFDVDALKKTQLFTALGGQAAIDTSLEKAPADLRPIAKQIAKSVRGISFWKAGEHGALYIETRDGRALAALLAKAPLTAGAPVDGIATYTSKELDEHLKEHAEGHDFHGHGHKPPEHSFLAVYGDTLVLSDSADTLAQSLRVLAGKAPNLAGSKALPVAARSGVFVFVTVGTDLLGEISKTSASKVMQLGAKSLVIDAGEAGGVVSANARAEMANADALAKAKSIVEGMRALASLSDEPGAKQLLDGVTISANGLALEIAAKWPVADLQKMIEHAHGK